VRGHDLISFDQVRPQAQGASLALGRGLDRAAGVDIVRKRNPHRPPLEERPPGGMGRAAECELGAAADADAGTAGADARPPMRMLAPPARAEAAACRVFRARPFAVSSAVSIVIRVLLLLLTPPISALPYCSTRQPG
jgi:hypothetical protein